MGIWRVYIFSLLSMAAKISLLGLILTSYPFLRSVPRGWPLDRPNAVCSVKCTMRSVHCALCIVQILRVLLSFLELSQVAINGLKLSWVILSCLELSWVVLTFLEWSQVVLRGLDLSQFFSSCIKLSWVVPGCFKLSWVEYSTDHRSGESSKTVLNKSDIVQR